MDRVPFLFCKSVITLFDALVPGWDPPLLNPFEGLRGLWGAADRCKTRSIPANLDLVPIDSDNWEYALDWEFQVRSWKDLLAATPPIAIHSVYVSSTPLPVTNYERISSKELRKLLSVGYRKLINITIGVFDTPQKNGLVAELLENLEFSAIWMCTVAPELEKFLCKALTSRNLKSLQFHCEIPHSLHPHVLQWAHRNEFHTMRTDKSPDFKVDISIFEGMVVRINKAPPRDPF